MLTAAFASLFSLIGTLVDRTCCLTILWRGINYVVTQLWHFFNLTLTGFKIRHVWRSDIVLLLPHCCRAFHVGNLDRVQRRSRGEEYPRFSTSPILGVIPLPLCDVACHLLDTYSVFCILCRSHCPVHFSTWVITNPYFYSDNIHISFQNLCTHILVMLLCSGWTWWALTFGEHFGKKNRKVAL